MIHFAPEEWADFARRNLPAPAERHMQEHLERGCTACMQTLQVWLGVLEVTAGLDVFSSFERGIGLVRTLFGTFPPHADAKSCMQVSQLVSAPEITAPQAPRSQTRPRRRLVFQHGATVLDIQIERFPKESSFRMTGYLSAPVAQGSRMGRYDVTLLSEQQRMSTKTSESGEFEFECGSMGDVMLVVEAADGSLMISPIPSSALSDHGKEYDSTQEE